MVIQWVIVILFVVGTFCQRFNFPTSSEPSFSVCENNGQICKLAENCPGVYEQVRRGDFPIICRFEAKQVFVCCTEEPVNHPICGQPREVITFITPGHNAFFRSKRSMKEQRAREVLISQASRVIEPEIVRGEETAENAYPWMAALGSRLSNGDIKWFCGGSLISRHLVLTAAHCLKEGDASVDLSLDIIRLGAHNLAETSEENTDDYNVAGIHVHPQYQAVFSYHDIAIIELSTAGEGAELRDEVGLVCLPGADLEIQEGSSVTVAGWGVTSFGGIQADKLREARVNVINQQICQKSYSRFPGKLPRGITQDIICAGDIGTGNNLKDACQGDSGGPLMNQVDGNTYQLVGVVSSGFGCGTPGFPGLYTRVSSHINWIQGVIQQTRRRYQ